MTFNNHFEIDDLKLDSDKLWIDGYSLAIEDTDKITKEYLDNLEKLDLPVLLKEIKTNTIKEYNSTLLNHLREQYRVMIDILVEDQNLNPDSPRFT